jgi:hypothetical protein
VGGDLCGKSFGYLFLVVVSVGGMHEQTVGAGHELPLSFRIRAWSIEHGPHDLDVLVGARHHLPVQFGPLCVDVPHHSCVIIRTILNQIREG